MNDCSATTRLTGATGKLLALVRTPEAHPDHRGSVRETYRESWFPNYVPPIKQLVQSNSKPMTLRGMHLHRKQWDIWRFTSDGALVRLYDHVSGDQAFVVGDKSNVIVIPPGISHGFFTKSGCTLLYGLTEEFDGTDEFGWFPFDGLPYEAGLLSQLMLWPRTHEGLNISTRDMRAPGLVGFVG